MYLAACFAANGYGHFGKSFENDSVGVQPGRNRRARMRTTSEDSRHGAAFYGKVQRCSRVKWQSGSPRSSQGALVHDVFMRSFPDNVYGRRPILTHVET